MDSEESTRFHCHKRRVRQATMIFLKAVRYGLLVAPGCKSNLSTPIVLLQQIPSEIRSPWPLAQTKVLANSTCRRKSLCTSGSDSLMQGSTRLRWPRSCCLESHGRSTIGVILFIVRRCSSLLYLSLRDLTLNRTEEPQINPPGQLLCWGRPPLGWRLQSFYTMVHRVPCSPRAFLLLLHFRRLGLGAGSSMGYRFPLSILHSHLQVSVIRHGRLLIPSRQ